MPSKASLPSSLSIFRPAWALGIFFAGMALVGIAFSLGAWALLKYSRHQATALWEQRLKAVAEDRGEAVEAWLDTNLADARAIADYPAIRELLAGTVSQPRAPGGQIPSAHLEGLLTRSVELKRYSGVYIVDPQARTAAQSTASSGLGPECLSLIREALESGQPKVLPFHPNARGIVTISFFAPVTNGAGANGPVLLGGVVIEIVPEVRLYPLLRSQPTPTDTGETLLVERSGDTIVFASPLRFKNVPCLSLSLPWETPSIAAKTALQGTKTFGSFSDYRGVPVLAATRPVKGTPFGLVAKVDQEEALKGYRTLRLSVLSFLALILAAIASLWLAFLYRLRISRLKEQGQRDKLYRVLRDCSRDLIILGTPDGTVIESNAATQATLGYSRKELEGMSFKDLRSPGAYAGLKAQISSSAALNGAVCETEYCRKDGSLLPVEEARATAEVDGRIVWLAVARDIMQRKLADRALRSSEQKFRTLFNSAADSIFIHDLGGRILEVNDRACECLRYSRDELLCMGIKDIDTPENAELFSSRTREVVQGGVGLFETAHVRKDGSIIPVEINALPVDFGGVPAMLSVARDLTERKRAEDALRESEVRFRLLAETAPEGIFIQTRGKFRYANPAFQALLGAESQEQVLGLDFIQFVHPDDRAAIGERANVVADGDSAPFIEERYLRLDGSAVSVEVSAAPFPYGSEAGALVIVRDITKRKLADEALLASQRITKGIINAIPVRVFWKDKALVYMGCNETFARDAGFTNPKEVIGKDDYNMGWRDQADLYRADDRHVMETGSPRLLIEEPQTTPAGKTITLLTSKIPLRGSQGEIIGVLGTYMDITERKRGEEELKAQAARLERLNEELQRFNRLAVGRETRMIELKQQMNALAAKHGEPPPFPLDFLNDEEAGPKG
jgi:PAS domain S-box-containing protein